MQELWALTKNIPAWDALAQYLEKQKTAIEKTFANPALVSQDELQRKLGEYGYICKLLKLRDQIEKS